MKECQTCKNCFADAVTTCPNDGMPTMHTIPGDGVLEGKYHLELRIGQGGMGVVYKARHAYLKTQLAIKVILPDLVGNDPQLVTRFRQEALAAAAIRHQNVVSVTDYGVIDGTLPFLVMEYVEGEALHDLLARENSLPPERAYELMAAICAGVGAAHHQGIVHRDLKPLNIMICSDKPTLSQSVKILDFGLAKIKSGELLGSFIQAQTTGLMGSPYYMAPEQWADDEPTPSADIYSLGVMLYQVLTGDVPFKGSSIPAIMKKHISDQPPTLADGGLQTSPAFELAVAHSLRKDPAQRTPSVEHFVSELREAIFPGSSTSGFIHTTAGSGALPVSSVKVKTKPAKSNIYVDNVSVGESRDNGELLLDGIQSGNHHFRVSHHGFQDWHGDVTCDGKPVEVVAELREKALGDEAIQKPDDPGGKTILTVPPQGASTLDSMAKTVQQSYTASRFDVNIEPPPIPVGQKKSSRSGLILGIVGLLALFVIGAVGFGAAYMLGVFSGGPPISNGTTPTPSTTSITANLASIPGGTFKMGRDDGLDNEKPANSVNVQAFKMDKTEVTNSEYFEFTKATGYKPLPAHWVNDKPIAGEEKMPVRFVNMDDIKAFAEWRSKRDGVTYRLPTEAEWEFAARNGAKATLYPWGDKFDDKCAVTDKDNTEPEAVGTASCPNDWGVSDLIGNLYEWTSSRASLYPGSKGTILPTAEPKYMIRGGAALTKSTGPFAINSAFRADVEGSKRDKELGFRLVTQAAAAN
ncbi:MAG: bifunctional serine/threonine-protein kinase/formylglycine-generating enzyme family protein [Pyrinomonadaceae bacterium]